MECWWFGRFIVTLLLCCRRVAASVASPINIVFPSHMSSEFMSCNEGRCANREGTQGYSKMRFVHYSRIPRRASKAETPTPLEVVCEVAVTKRNEKEARRQDQDRSRNVDNHASHPPTTQSHPSLEPQTLDPPNTRKRKVY